MTTSLSLADDADLLGSVLRTKREHEQAIDHLIDHDVLALVRSGNGAARVPGRAQALVLGFNRAHSDADTEIALLDLDGRLRGGVLPASRVGAADIHLAVLRERTEARAVLHAHTLYTTAYALAQRPLPLRDAGLRARAGIDALPVTDAVPGYDPAPVVATARAHPRARAVLVGNHGIWAWGDTLPQVAALIADLEREARMAFDIELLQRRQDDCGDGHGSDHARCRPWTVTTS